MGSNEAEREVLAAEERLRLADAGPGPDTSAGFQELFADDILLVSGGGVFPPTAVFAGHRPPRRRQFDEVRVSERTIRELGDVVVVACRTDYVLGDRSFGQRTVRLWRRVGGTWKVAVVAMMELPKDDP